MAKVIMHKAQDGSLHDKARDCEKRNIETRMCEPMQAFVKATVKRIEDDTSDDLKEDCERMVLFLIDNADALRKILNDAQTVKRPRKAKKTDEAIIKALTAPLKIAA